MWPRRRARDTLVKSIQAGKAQAEYAFGVDGVRRIADRVDYRLLFLVYMGLGLAFYAILRMEGSAGPVNWWGLAVWAFLLGMIVRGSRISWAICVVLSLLQVLALGLMGIDLAVWPVAILLLLLLQILVLLALYPEEGHQRPGVGRTQPLR